MKKLFIICILCAVFCTLRAQTYNNGVWYSLYDATEHTMNTQGDYSTSVFAPTTGALTVKWRYEHILIGVFKHVNTEVLESADGGSTTRQLGKLAENTANNSNTTENFTASRDINWIKYNRPDDQGLNGPTHKVIVYNQSLPLAKHILLASGTYGATTASHAFADQDMYSVSEAYTVSLRSFLTAGDITVTSSMPEVFRVGAADNTAGITFAVGANACASANGKAAAAGGANLGNIANYGIAIYFAPQEAKAYEATITITDGTSTATVTVSGTGLYVAPPIPDDTYYTYSAAICEGEAYADDLFSGLTEAGTYMDTIPNIAGGDSIITFTLTVNPVYLFEEQRTMLKGEAQTWQNIDLSVLPVGDTLLVASYQTVTECDSTYVLALFVQPRVTTYGNDTISLCTGEKAVYEGKTYRRSTVDSVLLSTPNIYGGDSIVELVVNVYPAVNITLDQTITEGETLTWEDIDLSTFPVGDTTLVASYLTVHGCDSTYVLHLTVAQRNTEGVDQITNDQSPITNKVLRDGHVFLRKGDAWYDLFGHKIQH